MAKKHLVTISSQISTLEKDLTACGAEMPRKFLSPTTGLLTGQAGRNIGGPTIRQGR
ncbi:MAG: hypothetical protein V2I39_05565 [Erythrobacter sp.]|nr:hypothetical protein [Erythrobacter sp.]